MHRMQIIYTALALLVLAIMGVSCAVADVTASGDTATRRPLSQMGTFCTKINQSEEGRVQNIRQASQSVHGKVVNPGETFSFNEAVGPTIQRRGYKLATIYVNGEKDEGFGGGVCQVSSTLYNAAAHAGMKILERHDHSLPVNYVERGKEAATSYGVKDFRFQNPHPFPCLIESHVEGGEISVTIYRI